MAGKKLIVWCIAGCLLPLSAAARGQDSLLEMEEDESASTQPAETLPDPRIFGDYAKVGNLSSEQKRKLNDIWVDIRAKKKALETDLETRSVAVLTPAQRRELRQMREQEKLAAREKARERSKSMKEMREEIARLKAENEKLSGKKGE